MTDPGKYEGELRDRVYHDCTHCGVETNSAHCWCPDCCKMAGLPPSSRNILVGGIGMEGSFLLWWLLMWLSVGGALLCF